jgi:transposase
LVAEAEVDAVERSGTTSEDAERIRRLEQENRELRRSNEIVKRVAVGVIQESGRHEPRATAASPASCSQPDSHHVT